MIRLSRNLALAATLVFGGVAWADSDSYDAPEMGGSADPDTLDGESENPDDLKGRSEDPDKLTIGADAPDSLVTGSEAPDSLLGKTENPDRLEGTSEDLGSLRKSDGSENALDPAPDLVVAVPAPGPNASANERAAWQQVGSAERNLDAANGAYENMIATDYPRGERRERIIAERNDAIEAVNRARTHYAGLRGD